MAYFSDGDDILCPHCGEEHDKDDWYPGDGEISEIECSNCGKTYTITTDIRYSYTTQCGNEDRDECEYKALRIDGREKRTDIGGKEVIYAQCANCGETAYVNLDQIVA